MEMMIVVILIGIVYSLVFTHIKLKKDMISLSSSPFKAVMLPFWQHSHLLLVCEYKCKECKIYNEKGILIAKDIPFPLDNFNISKVYKINDFGQIVTADFLEPINNNKICLRYDIYPNESSTELFIEDKNGSVYYIPPFLDKIQEFSSILEAKKYFEDVKMELSR